MDTIYVAITRTGKQTKHVEAAKGSTVRQLLEKAGLEEAEFGSWTIVDEDGDSLNLYDEVHSSTQLICGMRTSGAA